jgi:hypothetical protein
VSSPYPEVVPTSCMSRQGPVNYVGLTDCTSDRSITERRIGGGHAGAPAVRALMAAVEARFDSEAIPRSQHTGAVDNLDATSTGANFAQHRVAEPVH